MFTLAMLLAVAGPAAGSTGWGVAVQVNEGEAVPPAAVLSAVLPKAGTVRDMLQWARVEKLPGVYGVPAEDFQLYQVVASTGGGNVITLFGGNPLYGLPNANFPVTPAQLQGFAAYAAYLVANDGGTVPDAQAANIPHLAGVTIWNEFNGGYGGGIVGKNRPAAMAKLLSVVVPAIKKSNRTVKISAGAFVGHSGVAHWFAAIGQGFNWKQADWLDIHPYIYEAKGAKGWAREMGALREAGISNPCYYSEWGGPSAVKFMAANPRANYFQWFQQNIIAADSVTPKGGNFFELSNLPHFAGQGLTTGHSGKPAYQWTGLGLQFTSTFLPWVASRGKDTD